MLLGQDEVFAVPVAFFLGVRLRFLVVCSFLSLPSSLSWLALGGTALRSGWCCIGDAMCRFAFLHCGVAAAVSAMLCAVLLLPGSSLGDLDSFLVLDEWMFDSIWWLLYSFVDVPASSPALLAAFTTVCSCFFSAKFSSRSNLIVHFVFSWVCNFCFRFESMQASFQKSWGSLCL